MGRGPSQEGIEARQRILAELARRYLEYEAPPGWVEMHTALGMGKGTLEHHVRWLRDRGLVHPGSLWITRAGLDAVAKNKTLTS